MQLLIVLALSAPRLGKSVKPNLQPIKENLEVNHGLAISDSSFPAVKNAHRIAAQQDAAVKHAQFQQESTLKLKKEALQRDINNLQSQAKLVQAKTLEYLKNKKIPESQIKNLQGPALNNLKTKAQALHVDPKSLGILDWNQLVSQSKKSKFFFLGK